MAIPVIESVSTRVLDPNGIAIEINKPTGTVSGDLLVGFIQTKGTGAVTAPSGWSHIATAAAQFGGGNLHAYYKVAGSSEPASYSWTFADTYASGGIARISGVDTAAPINASATATDTSITTSQTSPAVTTTVNDCLILRGLGNERHTVFPVTPPASHTERWDIEGSSAFDATGTAMASIGQASSGSSGTATFTTSDTRGCGFVTVAVAPSAAAAATKGFIIGGGLFLGAA